MTNEDQLTGEIDSLSFEQSLARLDAIVRDLEEGQLDLAAALASYEQGTRLLKKCHGLLECAERRIELLAGVDAAGNPVVQPFDDESSLAVSERGQPRGRKRSSREKAAAAAPPGEVPPMDAPGTLF